jgi:tRNA nucleotidyltransferase/poly(A) polymerase
MNIQLYLVGGPIRDEILGVPCNDLDYTAVCSEGWDGLLHWANDFLDDIFVVKEEFLTIRGRKDKEIYDIVLSRKEGDYTDGRHPDTVVPGTLEDDLNRRDFTFNAMARLVYENGKFVDSDEIVDLHEGAEDLDRRRIRFVGLAYDRIREDALRILRAIRFKIVLGWKTNKPFYYESELKSGLTQNELGLHIPDLAGYFQRSDISRERVREELTKMYKCSVKYSSEVLFNPFELHPNLTDVFFGEDIWLKPTVEQK